MGTGRCTQPLVPRREEQSKLELMARHTKTDLQTALRARIVLACAVDLNNTAVATKRSITIQTVGKWRARFIAGSLESLGDAPLSGQRRKISCDKTEAVITRPWRYGPKTPLGAVFDPRSNSSTRLGRRIHLTRNVLLGSLYYHKRCPPSKRLAVR